MFISVFFRSFVKTKTWLHFLYWVEFPSVVKRCQKHEVHEVQSTLNKKHQVYVHGPSSEHLSHHSLRSFISSFTQTEERLTYLCLIISRHPSQSSARRWTPLPVSSCRPIRDLTVASKACHATQLSCTATATARVSSCTCMWKSEISQSGGVMNLSRTGT